MSEKNYNTHKNLFILIKTPNYFRKVDCHRNVGLLVNEGPETALTNEESFRAIRLRLNLLARKSVTKKRANISSFGIPRVQRNKRPLRNLYTIQCIEIYF